MTPGRPDSAADGEAGGEATRIALAAGGSPATRFHATVRSYRHHRTDTSLYRPFELTGSGGQIACLIGASGTGKTTLLSVLLGQFSGLFEGSVEYAVDGETLSPMAAAERGIFGFLAPGDSLVPWKSVADNLLLPARINHRLATPKPAELTAVLSGLALDPDVLEHAPHQLSFGMRQRVQFARLLLYRPRFCLLDEPFHGLDPANTRRLARVLRDYVSQTGTCCLLVTHDISTAQQTADCFFYLAAHGTLRSVPASPSEDDLLALFQEDLV